MSTKRNHSWVVLVTVGHLRTVTKSSREDVRTPPRGYTFYMRLILNLVHKIQGIFDTSRYLDIDTAKSCDVQKHKSKRHND